MAKLKRIQLFSKLDAKAYQALESATILCKTRGNPYIELTHWVNQIILGERTDWHEAVRHFELDEAKLAKDMIAAMDALPRGSASISDFSDTIQLAIKEAWMISSIVFNEGAIRTGHLLCALKQSPEFARLLHDMSGEFIKVNGDLLAEKFTEIVKNSSETSVAAPAGETTATGQAGALLSGGAMGKGEALKQYTLDMTAEAAAGRSDPIVGRDEEIRKVIDVLLRRRQNNPILTGDAGVGKTAVVEGFAQRLASGDVPPSLKGSRLLSLDMGLLQAGASMKGEFENRLKQVIEDVQSSETPIILFIDEAHTMIGAGGQAGQNDAANLLKPALARGKLRCIAATTYQEYIKYFEKDPALTRRFQNIIVEEPDDEKGARMMRGMVTMLEKHHGVTVMDEALIASVKLSRRYLPARQLPDKSVSILDTACAKVNLSQNAEPPELEYSRRRVEALELEIDILKREELCGANHAEKIAALKNELEAEQKNRAEINDRFEKEKKMVAEILSLYAKIKDQSSGSAGKAAADKDSDKIDTKYKAELEEKRHTLAEFQGEHPMVLPQVDTQAVSAVISEWTGIPLGRMVKDEIKSILSLDEELCRRVIGQDHGLKLIAKRVLTARASLSDPNKPTAVIMLAGPSGVGKTETALALAEQIYGSEEQIITINMSEFQEAHTVSTLKGAPPGYVGYGEGGVLTEAVRRKPYSVVLLDEVEKAHPDVHEIFFQVFDKGQMEDGAGRLVNFRNTIILLTTNVGDQTIERLCAESQEFPDTPVLEAAIREDMMRVFPAALLGRLQIVPYYPLGKEALCRIIDLKLGKIQKRVMENYGAELKVDGAVKDEIIRRCDNAASGARLIDAVIGNSLLPEISAEFLQNTLEGKKFTKVVIGVHGQTFTYSFEEKKAK
ncbi:MAG: type VI secretion system ATPase TssH [Spirochaetaceae bacterium]|jgi:type VI secretion system protein VasG|nr:type VI secretion system ATPase TssH [Spirochaetaceae bacterium]